MSAELIEALRELEREKGISFETILQSLEEALASAYKSSVRGTSTPPPEDEIETEGFRVTLEPESGEITSSIRPWTRTAPSCRREEVRSRGLPGTDRRPDGQAGHLPEAP